MSFDYKLIVNGHKSNIADWAGDVLCIFRCGFSVVVGLFVMYYGIIPPHMKPSNLRGHGT